MRDFRDAKAMAHTLRAVLAAKGSKITISQSLELIAEAFGIADWNTLAAAIRGEVTAPRAKVATAPATLMRGSALGRLGILPNLNSLCSEPSGTVMRENTSTRR